MTPTLSVAAVHVRLIALLDAAIAVNVLGAVGASVSGGAGVVAVATFE